MELIKKLWAKCGERKFTEWVLVAIIGLLTFYNTTFLGVPTWFNVATLILNVGAIFMVISDDDDERGN